MPFGRNTPPAKKGRPISARAQNISSGNADAAQRLRVGAGLIQASIAGIPTLQIALPGPIYHAQTTSAVTARAGATMGTGKFKLYTDLGTTTGSELVDAGLPELDGFSISGTGFDSGVWCYVARVNRRWKFLSADCSGVA